MATRFDALDVADFELDPSVRERLSSPALIVRMEHVRENLRRMLAYVGDPDRWRPHLKTTKMPAVWSELVRAGITRFKCATTREARHLLATLREEGLEGGDLLLAYPLVGPALADLGALADAYPETRVSVLCEAPELVSMIPVPVSIFIDVNPGMHRTGIPLEEREAVESVATLAGERLRGIHYYDGHLHDADVDARRAAIFACYDRLMELVEDLTGGGHSIGEIITSGTPSFQFALEYDGFGRHEDTLHRVSPGTVVFHDWRSELENPGLDLLPAAYVLSRVISRPTADVVTCDAGSKSIATEAGVPCAFVIGHPELVALEPSEEHLPLRVTSGARPERGDTLLLVPYHVCPTVNLAERALLVDGEDTRVVDVAARAHDLW